MNPYIVEKYQFMYKKNPQSKIFAPLAEAYRKAGEIEKAIDICKKGLKLHPYFAEGYVALAKLYFDQENFQEAAKCFQKAIHLSPENLLAHKLLAQSYLKLKYPKRALKAYKMLLFLSPYDTQAQKALKKLESLTADEYEDSSLFTFESLEGKPIKKVLELEKVSPSSLGSQGKLFSPLERCLSLSDALTVRGDLQMAEKVLLEAQEALGPRDEISERLKLLQDRESLKGEEIGEEPNEEEFELLFPNNRRGFLKREEKIQFLKKLLGLVKERKIQDGENVSNK